MTKHPAFYLISTAGFVNLGDEWITVSWLEAIFRRYPKATVYLDIHFPAGFPSLIQTRPYRNRVHCIDGLWQMTYPYAQRPLDIAVREAADVFENKRKPPASLRQVLSLLGRVSHLHFLGGGYFTAFWPHHYLMLVLAGLIKRRYGLPVYWTGGSLCPIEAPQLESLLPYLAEFDYIGFRDAESGRMTDGRLPQTAHPLPDDVILGLARGIIRPPAPSAEPTLLLNLQSDFRRPEGSAPADIMAEKIRFFQNKNYRAMYFEFIPKLDSEGFSFFSQRWPSVEKISFESLWTSTVLGTGPAPAILHPESYAIGSRFHFHYYLSWHGIRGEFISETPYYDIKHQSICDLKSNWMPLHSGPAVQQQPCFDKDSMRRMKQAEFDRLYPGVSA
jgi:hypothetical protein